MYLIEWSTFVLKVTHVSLPLFLSPVGKYRLATNHCLASCGSRASAAKTSLRDLGGIQRQEAFALQARLGALPADKAPTHQHQCCTILPRDRANEKLMLRLINSFTDQPPKWIPAWGYSRVYLLSCLACKRFRVST